MGRTGILPEISGITGFYELSCEHSETEYLRTTVGISDSDHPGTSSESDPEDVYKRQGDHRCLRDRKSENDTNDQTTDDALDQVDAVPFLNQFFHN